MGDLITVCRFPYDDKSHLQEDFGMFQDYNGNGPYDRLFSKIDKRLIEEVEGKYLLYLSTPHFHNNFVYNFKDAIERNTKLKYDIINKKVKFLFFRIGEFDSFSEGEFLHDEPYVEFLSLIKTYGCDDSDCMFLSFNFNIDYALRNSRIKSRYHNFCQLNLYNIIKDERDSLLNKFISTKNKRQYHYLCYNHQPKPHRDKVVDFLTHKNNGLLSYTKYNLILDGVDDEQWTTKNRNLYYYANKSHYNKSYFSIITESHYTNRESNKNNLSFTEKTWKPITNFHPFFIVGGYESMKKLRSLGFETFYPHFNESYDNLEFDDLFKELDRLLKMDINEIHNIYYGMKEVLIHNFNHYFKICEKEIKDLQNDLFDFCYKE